jgi:hypothetical protein
MLIKPEILNEVIQENKKGIRYLMIKHLNLIMMMKENRQYLQDLDKNYWLNYYLGRVLSKL